MFDETILTIYYISKCPQVGSHFTIDGGFNPLNHILVIGEKEHHIIDTTNQVIIGYMILSISTFMMYHDVPIF